MFPGGMNVIKDAPLDQKKASRAEQQTKGGC